MQDMALMVFEMLGCRDLGRVDFQLDEAEQPAFLEINPLPGLSPYYSIYPTQAVAAGISYEELIGEIVEVALKRCFDRKRV